MNNKYVKNKSFESKKTGFQKYDFYLLCLLMRHNSIKRMFLFFLFYSSYCSKFRLKLMIEIVSEIAFLMESPQEAFY